MDTRTRLAISKELRSAKETDLPNLIDGIKKKYEVTDEEFLPMYNNWLFWKRTTIITYNNVDTREYFFSTSSL